ncbi:MAG TPA: sugar ABC transporter permease, partial [Gaiellaceae bacterium]
RTLFFLPSLTPIVASAVIWTWLYNPDWGLLNYALSTIGIKGPKWLADPDSAMLSLIAVALWSTIGGNTMIIFLAAVLDVPRHLYESAELDGAGPFQRLRWVTLPTISPVILFSVILGVIQGLQYFTQAYVAAGVAAGQASQAADVTAVSLGYPLDSTLMYPVLLYQHGFTDFQMGYASAMAMLLLGVAFSVTLVIVVNSRRWVHYGGVAR